MYIYIYTLSYVFLIPIQTEAEILHKYVLTRMHK